MSTPLDPGIDTTSPVDQSLITYTNIIYGLHAFAVVCGILSTAATVVGGFIFSLPSIVAVIMNYARRPDVRGTWLESHFNWQIRTFWVAVITAIVLAAVSLVLAVILIGIALWYVGALALGVWIAYRVTRGWMALRDRRVMPAG